MGNLLSFGSTSTPPSSKPAGGRTGYYRNTPAQAGYQQGARAYGQENRSSYQPRNQAAPSLVRVSSAGNYPNHHHHHHQQQQQQFPKRPAPASKPGAPSADRSGAPSARRTTPLANLPTNGNGKQCAACGDPEHSTGDCKYSTRLCFHCRQEGHKLSVCPKRRPRNSDNSSSSAARPPCSRSQHVRVTVD